LVDDVLRLYELPGFLPHDSHDPGSAGEAPPGGRRGREAAGHLRLVDAKRDTPQQLAKYVPYFDPEFLGVTAADQPTIERIARKLGVGVIITPAADGGYTVDHSGAIFVLDPDGKLAAILTGPFTVDALQADLGRIMAARA
jgi:protein SCO1/2